MYEDTIFVLAGDHYGISEKYEDGLNELLGTEATVESRMKHQQIPLIIHIPGQTGETISTPGGAIDIRPTLLHLMGINAENRYAFGYNLFTRDTAHPVIFRDGSFISDDHIYKNNVCYSKDSGAAIDEEACGPDLEIVRKELKLSDKIIFGDLLRFVVGEK